MASITISQMKDYLIKLYPGEGWKYRVEHLMKDNQIIAIYSNAINRSKKKKEPTPHQMTLFEWSKANGGKML